MKGTFRKIMSVKLAILVLLTTTSFSLSFHYCCDELVDISIFRKAKNCEELSFINSCEENRADFTKRIKTCAMENSNNCCTTKNFGKTGDLSDKSEFINFENQVVVFSCLFFYTYIDLLENLERNVIPFENYKPPLVLKDIIVLHETYLI